MVMQTVILGFSFYCLELVRRLSRFYRDSDSVDHSRQLFVGRIEFSRAKGFMQRKMDPFLWKSIESIGLSYIYTLKYGIQYFFFFSEASFDRYNNMVNSINRKTWLDFNGWFAWKSFPLVNIFDALLHSKKDF